MLKALTKLLLPVLLIAGAAVCRAQSHAQTSASESRPELRIGASAALSGPAAQLGQRYHAGARALFEQINQHGGIHGARVVLDLRDDAYEPDRADLNTRQLSEDGRVLALFGYVGTPTSRVALPYVKRAALPFVGAFTGADMLYDPANPHLFPVRASYNEEAVALVKAMKAAGARRVNVLMQADLFGRAGLEAMRDALAGQGLSLGSTATTKRNTTQVDEAVQQLVRDSHSDAIFMVSTYETLAAFVRKARAAGYKGGLYTLSFAGLEPLRAALGEHWQGLQISEVVPNPEDRSIPAVAAYQKAMLDAGERRFDSISLEGYLAARVLCEGLRRAHPPLTRASLVQGLESLGELDLGGFSVRYGSSEHQSSHYVALRGSAH